MRILTSLFAATFLSSCVAGTLAFGTDVSGGGDDDDAVADDDDDGIPDADGDGDPDVTDCDDEDPDVATTLEEVCGDGKDNDCDPTTHCYVVRKDGDERYVEPVAGNESAVDFYGYGEDAGGTHGLEVSDALAIWLYQDPQEDLWLMLSVDGWDDGSGGFLLMDLTNTGRADLAVVDDDGEGFNFGDGITFQFQWVDCCVDGAVVGPLDEDFCVSAEVYEAQGLNEGLVTYDGGSLNQLGPVQGRTEICLDD